MKYLLDIDGTLLDSSKSLPGSAELINLFNDKNIDYLLMTNSIKSPDIQIERLKSANILTDRDRIISPITAINKYITEIGFKKVKIIGTDDEVIQVNAENVNKNYELVILLDFEKGNFGYSVLQDIVDDMENSIEIVTASVSPYYLKNGRKAIDTGSFVSLLERIGGKKIKNFGKPSKDYFSIAGNILNEKAGNIYVVGDDYSTDIIGANENGAKSILVKTGKYKIGDEEKVKAFIVINSLNELKI